MGVRPGGFRALAALALLALASCAAPRGGTDPQGVRGFDSLDVAGLMRLAGNFERSGDYESAIGFYVRAMRKAPDDAEIPAALGNLFLERGDLTQAEPLYLRARALDPENLQATAGLARLYVSSDRPDEALALLAPLHAAGRGTAGSFNSAAVAHDLRGEHEAARLFYTRALLETPEDTDILSNLALSMAVAGEYAAAHDLLDGLAERPGQVETAMENRSLVLALEGRTGEAEDLARRVQPEETVRLNRLFYRALPNLDSGPARARAVFLGRLPDTMPEPVQQAVLAPETPPAAEVFAPPVEKADAAPVAVNEDLPVEPAAPVASAMPVIVEADADAAARIPAYHLQLGSFSDEERARKGWELYARQDVLSDLGASIEPIAGGQGAPLHRLLAGPVTGYSAAQAVCRALAEAEIPCLVIPERPDAVALAP